MNLVQFLGSKDELLSASRGVYSLLGWDWLVEVQGEEGNMVSSKLGGFKAGVSKFGGAKLNKSGRDILPCGKWESL